MGFEMIQINLLEFVDRDISEWIDFYIQITHMDQQISWIYTGCPEKNAPQFLLNTSKSKHPRRLGHDSFERWHP